MVLDAQREGRIWATAIRPCVIYGRRDRQFIPRVARLFSTGFAPSLRGGRTIFSIVHAANVADLAILASHTDVANGAVYNAANDHAVTVREFVMLAADGLGRSVRLIPIPLNLARGAARLVTGIAHALGKGGSFTPSASVDFLSRDNPFNSDKARRELGWRPPVHPREGVPDAFRWWKHKEGAVG
jgi:nucleoside-diphosphate-sugar epimerase